jgi:hypothetical protein
MEEYMETIAFIPESIKKDFENNEKLVAANISFLHDLGVKEYKNIFKIYYPMFLMDASNFASIFNKYDKSDLLDKISKNITIVEHL